MSGGHPKYRKLIRRQLKETNGRVSEIQARNRIIFELQNKVEDLEYRLALYKAFHDGIMGACDDG
ncbi:Uncharacterised protein [uncultured archaeon]|nr:Uncharacterised protein [uncultured archaeon]